ncbi:hypothetical protein FRB99_008547, partial [Tulasnella sp. 403]
NAVGSQPASSPLSSLEWLGLLWQKGLPPKNHSEDGGTNWAWLCPATASESAEDTGYKTHRGPAVVNFLADGYFTIQLPFVLDDHAVYTMDLRVTVSINDKAIYTELYGSTSAGVRLALE